MLLLGSVAFPSRCFPNNEVGLRYWIESATYNRLNPTFKTQHELSPNLDWELFASGKHTWKAANTVDAGTAINLHPCSATRVQLRLSHHYLFESNASLTHLLLFGEVKIPIIAGSYFYGRLGWYERTGKLSGATYIPTPFLGQFQQHDFILTLGLFIPFSEKWNLNLYTSTIDDWEVYNLNNPFAEARLSWLQENKTEFSLLFRYQILLGFGRLDRLLLGVMLRY